MPKYTFLLFLVLFLVGQSVYSQNLAQKIAKIQEAHPQKAKQDWLLKKPEAKAQITRIGNKDIVMHNGLVSRSFRVAPNTFCWSYKNLQSGEEYIRSPRTEAMIRIDSIAYKVGGLTGLYEHGYFLAEWLDQLTLDKKSFQLFDFEIKDQITAHIKWEQSRWIPETQWQKSGKGLVFYYKHPAPQLSDIVVEIHYEIYDNIPLIAKWLVVENYGTQTIVLNHFTSEIIAHPEKSNFVDIPKSWEKPNFHIENDFAFGGFTYEESEQALSWEIDTTYTSQVNWRRQTPVVLKSQPHLGPNKEIKPGASFSSFRTYTLAFDGNDRERNSLTHRKMYRLLAPWVTENPIFMHLTSTDPEVVKTAIDQCEETGYEMLILSFGSGLSMEDISAENIAKFKKLVDYAHAKGIQLGGYSLFSSRRINDETDVIDRKTGKPGGAKFGNAPCAGSEWGLNYFENLKSFIEKTGFDILEHDGPYPGDFCASENHPGHEGYEDSQYKQWQISTDFYKWLRGKGVYTNIPDLYLLSGSNKVGIGYREVNWSLPRAQQILLGRQNIYDGTWTRTPSMGWTFVPLTQYHGGGAAATLEPLKDHLKEYAAHMSQNYGSGVQACYRGPRLYDSDETKKLVIEKIKHYKKYRDILNADIIHLRRPDGRDWDGILHVDPELEIKGFAMIYNPSNKVLKRTIELPLYYTGLEDTVQIAINEGTFKSHKLARNYMVALELEIPAEGYLEIKIK